MSDIDAANNLKSGYSYAYSAKIPPFWRNSMRSNVPIELSYAVCRCSQFRHPAHPQLLYWLFPLWKKPNLTRSVTLVSAESPERAI
jgi:hypothetical protein